MAKYEKGITIESNRGAGYTVTHFEKVSPDQLPENEYKLTGTGVYITHPVRNEVVHLEVMGKAIRSQWSFQYEQIGRVIEREKNSYRVVQLTFGDQIPGLSPDALANITPQELLQQMVTLKVNTSTLFAVYLPKNALGNPDSELSKVTPATIYSLASKEHIHLDRPEFRKTSDGDYLIALGYEFAKRLAHGDLDSFFAHEDTLQKDGWLGQLGFAGLISTQDYKDILSAIDVGLNRLFFETDNDEEAEGAARWATHFAIQRTLGNHNTGSIPIVRIYGAQYSISIEKLKIIVNSTAEYMMAMIARVKDVNFSIDNVSNQLFALADLYTFNNSLVTSEGIKAEIKALLALSGDDEREKRISQLIEHNILNDEEWAFLSLAFDMEVWHRTQVLYRGIPEEEAGYMPSAQEYLELIRGAGGRGRGSRKSLPIAHMRRFLSQIKSGGISES